LSERESWGAIWSEDFAADQVKPYLTETLGFTEEQYAAAKEYAREQAFGRLDAEGAGVGGPDAEPAAAADAEGDAEVGGGADAAPRAEEAPEQVGVPVSPEGAGVEGDGADAGRDGGGADAAAAEPAAAEDSAEA